MKRILSVNDAIGWHIVTEPGCDVKAYDRAEQIDLGLSDPTSCGHSVLCLVIAQPVSLRPGCIVWGVLSDHCSMTVQEQLFPYVSTEFDSRNWHALSSSVRLNLQPVEVSLEAIDRLSLNLGQMSIVWRFQRSV